MIYHCPWPLVSSRVCSTGHTKRLQTAASVLETTRPRRVRLLHRYVVRCGARKLSETDMSPPTDAAAGECRWRQMVGSVRSADVVCLLLLCRFSCRFCWCPRDSALHSRNASLKYTTFQKRGTISACCSLQRSNGKCNSPAERDWVSW